MDASPGVCELPPGAVLGHHLRVLYLVPSDREAEPARVANLESAVRHAQYWFSAQTPGGLSFLTHAPTVEVRELPNPAAYYATNAAGSIERLWFFQNVTTDAFEVSSARFDDPLNRWVFAIEAEPDCEQEGSRSARGTVVLSSQDLDVLAGGTRPDVCGGEPEDKPRCAQVGQLAFHLGRVFGLSRPPGCVTGDGPCDERALMESGADAYPDALLTDVDNQRLADSPYFRPLNPCPRSCERAVE